MVLFCVQCCVCRKRLSSPRCRSELIDSAWVVIVPGQKGIKNDTKTNLGTKITGDIWHIHFKNLHTADTGDITKPGDNTQYQSPGSELNSPFTITERTGENDN